MHVEHGNHVIKIFEKMKLSVDINGVMHLSLPADVIVELIYFLSWFCPSCANVLFSLMRNWQIKYVVENML